MNDYFLEDNDYHNSISKEYVNNILKLASGEEIDNFFKLEKDQTNYLINLISLDEDGELIRDNVFNAIDILKNKLSVLNSTVNDLNIKSIKASPGIDELKKKIQLNDSILKWKERKQITKHDWTIKVTNLAYSAINNQTFICELAGSFLNDAIKLIDNKEAVEKIEYAKREIYKLLRYFELQSDEASEYLNDELDGPDEPV